MLEWMGNAVIKQFETTRESPFDFKFVRVITMADMRVIYGRQRACFLTTTQQMFAGDLAFQLFTEYLAAEVNNTVVFT